MEDTSSYVLPSDSEKLSHKFILDAIKRREEEKPGEPSVPEPVEQACGTQTELPLLDEPSRQEDLPLQALDLPASKQYFRIGEVSELIGVEPHVLRYWESEFPVIRPQKSGGQRVYRRKDVENLHLIRHLLHVEKFSIKGAKKKLTEKRKELQAAPPEIPAPQNKESLSAIAQQLRELIRLAQSNPGL